MKRPFECLGYNHGHFFYRRIGSQHVAELTVWGYNRGNLIQLAPDAYWDITYGTKDGVNWREARRALIHESYAVGVYKPLA